MCICILYFFGHDKLYLQMARWESNSVLCVQECEYGVGFGMCWVMNYLSKTPHCCSVTPRASEDGHGLTIILTGCLYAKVLGGFR